MTSKNNTPLEKAMTGTSNETSANSLNSPLHDNDDWLAEDESVTEDRQTSKPWRLLVVDDEPDVHAVTRLAVGNLVFKGRGVEVLSAYSGREGYEVLARETDIALIFLDVVMETEDAGLRLARRIREELENTMVRIVLRTGQPGQAPERQVIIDYDINDYKAKTELSTEKLFTTVVASFRSYEGLMTLDAHRRGLNRILEASSNLYQISSLKELASGVLTQVGAILSFGAQGVLCVKRGSSKNISVPPLVMAASGDTMKTPLHESLPHDHPWADIIAQTFIDRKSQFTDAVDVLLIEAAHGHQFAVAFSPPWSFGDMERSLLNIFCSRIAAAFDNLHMYGQLKTTQEATVVALADLAESRDATTGGHVRRVCSLTDAIARELKAREKFPQDTTNTFLSFVGIASILHDVGKVATPDAVLLKPGRHTPEERKIMEEHATIGETVLHRASQLVDGESTLSIGAQIAGGHHEHFDGRGYPRGLKGYDIPLAARIVAVVDVFDALLHCRPYKEPWPLDAVMTYLHERRGTQFDPDVLDALQAFVDREPPESFIGQGH